jgi:hypothetical protein
MFASRQYDSVTYQRLPDLVRNGVVRKKLIA